MTAIQAVSAFRPNGASAAGCMKMPMPIVLPTTSAVHIQNPSWACLGAVRTAGGSSASLAFIVLRSSFMLRGQLSRGVKMSRVVLVSSLLWSIAALGAEPRARDLGVPFEGRPGPLNAITDVQGVTVGQVTLIEDLASNRKVRTGVT